MLGRWLLLCIVVVSSCTLSAGLRAGEPASTPAEIDGLIHQLGSEDFSERQEACRRLKQIGPPAIPGLRAAAKGNDAEVRRRAADAAAVIENTLEQLVIDYRAFGLPLPPKDAKLVRCDTRAGGGLVNGKVQPKIYRLVFQITDGSVTKGPIVLRGTHQWEVDQERLSQVLTPEPDALKDVISNGDELALAIQCEARGWHKLAEHLLEQHQKHSAATVRVDLLQTAWYYWELQLTEPKIDRAPIANRLKEIIGRSAELDTDTNRALLKSLELALVPSKAKPGSIEAIIDDLVDCGSKQASPDQLPIKNSYPPLVQLGFDAVPALIEHLDDDRLTRGKIIGYYDLPPRHLRVRDYVSDLLEGLAGQDLGRDHSRLVSGFAIEKAAAQAWWEEARKFGEEAYLLKHVLPADAHKNPYAQINGHQLQVIESKYPRHVPTLYRTLLDQVPELDSALLAEAVTRSRMPVREKLALFLQGARHKDNRHRLRALDELKELDKKEFNVNLIATIAAFPDDVAGPYWLCPEAPLARLAISCDDPRVWVVLEKVAKRSAVGLRMELLSVLDRKADPHRVERLRLLAAFLTDADVRDIASSKKYEGPCAEFWYEKLSVQNFAALQLAFLLGTQMELKPERRPDEWAELRVKVRQALDRELG